MQMVKPPLERELEKHFAKEIKRLGLMTLKLQIMGRRGWPDRLVVHNGTVYLAELKTEHGELSPLQEGTFAKLKARGIFVIILRTKTGITNYLEFISVQ